MYDLNLNSIRNNYILLLWKIIQSEEGPSPILLKPKYNISWYIYILCIVTIVIYFTINNLVGKIDFCWKHCICYIIIYIIIFNYYNRQNI